LHSLQETKQLFKSGTRRKLPLDARENKFACASFSLVRADAAYVWQAASGRVKISLGAAAIFQSRIYVLALFVCALAHVCAGAGRVTPLVISVRRLPVYANCSRATSLRKEVDCKSK